MCKYQFLEPENLINDVFVSFFYRIKNFPALKSRKISQISTNIYRKIFPGDILLPGGFAGMAKYHFLESALPDSRCLSTKKSFYRQRDIRESFFVCCRVRSCDVWLMRQICFLNFYYVYVYMYKPGLDKLGRMWYIIYTGHAVLYMYTHTHKCRPVY